MSNDIKANKNTIGECVMLEYKNCCGIELINSMDNDSIDLLLTDPPYNISRENNFKTMGRSGIDFGEWDKDFDLYSWIAKSFPKIKKGGSLVIFNDWKNIGEIAKYAESLGFEIKDMLRWEKTNPMPRNRDRRYITDYETAVWLVKPKGKWVFNRLSASYDRPKLSYASPQGKKRIHPTQKPIELLEELILRHSNAGDLVVDPFAGSGSCYSAYHLTGRNFLGAEIDSEMYEKASKLLKEDTTQSEQ